MAPPLPKAYDDDNIFAKILRGEIPCDKVYENDHALAFKDIAPQAPTHVLVIPKGKYISFEDFSRNASDEEITGFVRAAGEVARGSEGAVERGFRILANHGPEAHPVVHHFHLHIFAGRDTGPMISQ